MINNEDAVVISDNAKYLFHNDQAIILNRTNRQWIKISKECYEVLMQCNGKYTIKELLHMLIDNEDREYVKRYLMLWMKWNLLENTNEKNCMMLVLPFQIDAI